MSTLLEVKNLKKYFKVPAGTLHAVDDVSFQIETGTTMGVVGESGCGKSTLGRTLIHLLPPTEGQILLDGKSITNVKKRQLHTLRKNMQMIFQDPFSSLNPRMSVSQAIGEPLQIYGLVKNKQELDRRVRETMDTVGLAARLADSYPHELDGGRRQRIGIARALVLQPRFIVCDEPVSALDVSIQAQILNLLMGLQKELKLSYLFISHDLNVVRHISSRVGVMYLGRLVEIGDTEEVYLRPVHPYTQALLSAIPKRDPSEEKKRIHLTGDVPSPANPPKGCAFHDRCPQCMAVCKEEVPPEVEVGPGHKVRCHLCGNR